MKNRQAYVKVAVIVAIIGTVLLILLSMILNGEEEKRDPMIVSFHEVMYSLASDEYKYHAKEEIMETDTNGTILSISENEYYNDHNNFLIIKKYEEQDKEFHELMHDGYYYSYDLEGEAYHINKQEMSNGFYARPIIHVSRSYFALDDKYITYEEVEDGYLFQCDNQTKVGTGYDSNGETISHVCDSARAEIYLDKDWKIQKINVVEEWTQMNEDGIKSEYINNISLIFYDMSEQSICDKINEEHEFFESLLK